MQLYELIELCHFAKVPKLLCQLDQHLGCVNCVRWSKSGQYLASAGDDKVVIIWQLSNYGGKHHLSLILNKHSLCSVGLYPTVVIYIYL